MCGKSSLQEQQPPKMEPENVNWDILQTTRGLACTSDPNFNSWQLKKTNLSKSNNQKCKSDHSQSRVNSFGNKTADIDFEGR